MNKRQQLDRATKRSKTPDRTWQQARDLGMKWCIAMWPDVFQTPGPERR